MKETYVASWPWINRGMCKLFRYGRRADDRARYELLWVDSGNVRRSQLMLDEADGSDTTLLAQALEHCPEEYRHIIERAMPTLDEIDRYYS